MPLKAEQKDDIAAKKIVAIKQFNINDSQGNQEYREELVTLSRVHHPNLITLIGYCIDGDQKLLVFEFMPMGNLEDHLFGTHVSTGVMGTNGYCASEYATSGKLTFKSDIYSFGVFLMEPITGRKAVDTTKPPPEQDLVTWVCPLLKNWKKYLKLVDPLLER